MSVTASLTALGTIVLTRVPPGTPGTERGEEFGKTSPIALVTILLLLLASIVLIRSMSKRLRNVPESFDDPRPGDSRPGGARPVHDDDPHDDPPGGGRDERGAGRSGGSSPG